MRRRPPSRILAAAFGAAVGCLAAAASVVPARRTARVDAEGVMRWTDDGSEVAVFGVNYYTPFALDYRVIGERGYDRREVIRRDVAHFRRLGLTALRLHCFDREFSTKDGRFLENDHVDCLDYLIAQCASNGIYTVLTPIAAWGGGVWTSATNGFACGVSIRDLTCRADLRPAQVRFQEEFARHVNRYTGRRYADDPAVLCFELINEPGYEKGRTGEQIAAYANALLDGIRRSGTKKPVFYSATWNGHNECIPFLKTDGVSGVYYATGLLSRNALEGPQLHRVQASSLKADPRHAKMAKIVYEFDAADTPGSYMYPAMAKLFRFEGVQSATQFQYDPYPIADDNTSYWTHYLNLVYTPAKAISFAIAAEVFRRTPRGTPFAPAEKEMRFPPFRVNAESDLSEMVTETDLLYSSKPLTRPPAPAKLRRVWGCGSSEVVASTGSGCYFLDRVAEGLWRLQLYPNVLPCADPHTGEEGVKTVVLGGPVSLAVKLPDLGDAFSVWRTEDGGALTRAKDGTCAFRDPGDYILAREGAPSAARLAQAQAFDLPRFFAPPPAKPDPKRRRWPRSDAQQVADIRAKCAAPAEWNFFDAKQATRMGFHGGWTKAGKDDLGRAACQYRAENFVYNEAPSVRLPMRGRVWAAAFPGKTEAKTLVVRGRCLERWCEPVEFAFTLEDGQVWGTIVSFPKHWAEVRVPLSAFGYFKHWNPPSFKEGYRLDPGRLQSLSLCIGKWLDPNTVEKAHGFEISSVRFE